jgi:hypothetical protein
VLHETKNTVLVENAFQETSSHEITRERKCRRNRKRKRERKRKRNRNKTRIKKRKKPKSERVISCKKTNNKDRDKETDKQQGQRGELYMSKEKQILKSCFHVQHLYDYT